MKKASFALVLVTVLCLGAWIGNVVFATENSVIPGGYEKIDTTDKVVLASLAYMQNNFPVFRIEKVNQSYRQVVAGLNIKLVCNVTCMGKKGTWELTIYKNLEGTHFFTGAKELLK